MNVSRINAVRIKAMQVAFADSAESTMKTKVEVVGDYYNGNFILSQNSEHTSGEREDKPLDLTTQQTNVNSNDELQESTSNHIFSDTTKTEHDCNSSSCYPITPQGEENNVKDSVIIDSSKNTDAQSNITVRRNPKKHNQQRSQRKMPKQEHWIPYVPRDKPTGVFPVVAKAKVNSQVSLNDNEQILTLDQNALTWQEKFTTPECMKFYSFVLRLLFIICCSALSFFVFVLFLGFLFTVTNKGSTQNSALEKENMLTVVAPKAAKSALRNAGSSRSKKGGSSAISTNKLPSKSFDSVRTRRRSGAKSIRLNPPSTNVARVG